MSETKPPKRRLRKDDLKTFSRLLVFAKPYWWRLAIGAVTSALGGGSIIAMFIVAQQLLSFLVDNHALMDDEPAPPAIEQVVDAAADTAAPADPAGSLAAGTAAATGEAAGDGVSVAPAVPAGTLAAAPKNGYFDRMSRKLSGQLLGEIQ